MMILFNQRGAQEVVALSSAYSFFLKKKGFNY